MNDGVLITDGDTRITLSVLKSLARKNIKTIVAAEKPRALSFFSRHCKKRIVHSSPKKDLHGFFRTIQKIVKKTNVSILFPMYDRTLLPISEYRERISPHVKLPLPTHESVKKAFDKELTIKAAMEEGIPTPRTLFISSMKQLKKVSREVTYPAVIKPRWSWVWKEGKALYRRPSYVNSASELLLAYKTIHEENPFPMIQEYIPGQNFSVAALFDHSQPTAACCIKAHRALPVTGGNSVLRESVSLNPKMKRYAFHLLKTIEWHGIAEVEFKMDLRDSTPKLMEVNGRFWGSLNVAIACGVDFPYLLYRLVMNENVKPVFSYKTGVKFRWLEGDIRHLFSILTRKPRSCISYPNKLRTLFAFLKFYERDMNYDSLSSDDPLPFVIPFARLLRIHACRSLKRARRVH